MIRSLSPDEFSPSERRKIRTRIILLGIVRLVFMVLAMTLLSAIGFLLLGKILLAVHLHALK
jgi:hypothetical protein